jgi:hypothetical protein
MPGKGNPGSCHGLWPPGVRRNYEGVIAREENLRIVNC